MTDDEQGAWNDETRREFEQRYQAAIERRLAEYAAALGALIEQINTLDEFIESLGDS